MAKKTICVQEATEIDITFNDRIYTATFNMKSVLYMQEEIAKTGLQNLPYEHFVSLALYSGIKVNHPGFTMEEANALVMTMRPMDVNSIIEEYIKSVDGIDISQKDEKLKNLLTQILRRAV